MRFIALLLLITNVAWAEDYKFVGKAYTSEKKEKIAYIEKHNLKVVDNKVLNSLTEYYTEDDKKIAVLKCDYTKERFAPSFEFTDLRTGYWENMEHKDGKVLVRFKENKNAKEQTKNMDITRKLSASQGLNEFIKYNIPQLKKGEDAITSFVLPSRLRDIDMLIRGKNKGDDRIQVSIDVKNILLRIFAPSIKMTYSVSTGNLLRYYGNSNIFKDNGEAQKVYIEYDYKKQLKVANYDEKDN